MQQVLSYGVRQIPDYPLYRPVEDETTGLICCSRDDKTLCQVPYACVPAGEVVGVLASPGPELLAQELLDQELLEQMFLVHTDGNQPRRKY